MTTLTVELPDNIIYVAGYVNGVMTVFQKDVSKSTRWKAFADVAEDNLYHISLEMHDEAGNVGYYDDVVEYVLPVFIYDRTQADVDRVYQLRSIGWQNMTEVQRSEWLGGMKGCLNTADLKRIESNIDAIAKMLDMVLQSQKDNLPEIPDDLYFQQMLNNVSKLRATGYVYGNTPFVPMQPLNTYQKINDIEHILHDVYEIYIAHNNYKPYCGTDIYAGEDLGIL